MKKLIAATIGTVGMLLAVGSSQGQGTLNLNNYDSGFGLFDGNQSTPAVAGTSVQVLVGASAGSLQPIVNVSASPTSIFTASDINGNGPGTGTFFDGNYGHVTGVAPGSIAFVEVLAWSGAASYAAALTTPGAWYGASAIFSEATGTSPASPSTPAPAVLALPGTITLVQAPEPTTIALGGLGAAALLLFRRRK
jgi:PEP-CTERM motif